MPKPVLIDCTLRDGGYYNNWSFSKPLVEDYLQACARSGLEIVELGFRTLDRRGFKGPLAFTTESYTRTLKVPAGLTLAVMVNASDLVQWPEGPDAAIRSLFGPRSESCFDLARVAAHVGEVPQLGKAMDALHALGYRTGLNLMQISDRTDAEIESVATAAASMPIDVLYFADSLGGMNPQDVKRVYSAMRNRFAGPIGIHTHDNMGRALINTVAAIEEGATWVDSTVLGMGRGPGNVRTEYLLLELNRLYDTKYNPAPILKCIEDWFEPLHHEYRWGPNPYYYLSGMYGIHPTYVQEMLSDHRYASDDVLGALEFLRQVGGKKYSQSTLAGARRYYSAPAQGSWSATGFAAGREVLLLAAGPSAAEHREAIEAFIRSTRPLVIALNTQAAIDESLIDVRAACHPVRLLVEAESYRQSPQPLIVPYSMLPDEVRSKLDVGRCLDYGLSIGDGAFTFEATHCVIPSALVSAYALAVATAAGARHIYLAGFDGFSADDPRQGEMSAIFASYLASPGAASLESLTPTRYNVTQSSVYAQPQAA